MIGNNVYGGGNGKEKYYIYNNGQELNGHTITFHHKGSTDKKDLNWIHIYDFYMSVTSTDKISCEGYSKIFAAAMGDGRTTSTNPTRFTYLKLTDESGAALSEENDNDYVPNGNILTELNLANYPDSASFGGIYSIDIPDGTAEFYLHIQNVNIHTYILAIWLE